MKRLIALLGVLLCSVAGAQTLPYVPTPVAVYVSATGAVGSWKPATASSGTALKGIPSTSIGVYCSADGTGNSGTWEPCSGFPAGTATLVQIPSQTAVYVSASGSVGSWKPLTGANGTALPSIPPSSIAAYCSSDGTGNLGTWAPCGYSGGTAGQANPIPVGLYCSLDGTGHAGTWAPCATSLTPPPPISAWPSNEGSGLTLHDTSGNSNTATINTASAVTWQSNAGFPGITTLLNGTVGFAQASSATLTNFDGSAPFSIGLWISNTQAPQGALLSTLNAGGGSFQGWEVEQENGKLGFFLINTFPSNAIYVVSTFNTLDDGTRHYVVVAYDGSKTAAGVTLYVDGVARTKTVNNDTLTGSTASGIPPFFARRNNATSGYIGVMAFEEIWPYLVSSSQVSTNFAAGPAIY